MRISLATKLAVGFSLPTVILFAAFAWVTQRFARDELDAALGDRLLATASGAAAQVRGKYLLETAAAAMDERAIANTERKLATLAADSGARLYVFGGEFIARVDSAGQFPRGERIFQAELHRVEIGQVLASGKPVASPTFEGQDGRLYKAGYAPVRASEAEPDVVLVLAAEAPASYFDQLALLERTLWLSGVGLVVVAILAAVVIAHLMTRRLRLLGQQATELGLGKLGEPFATNGNDEIAALGQAMDHMRHGLVARDAQLRQMVAGIAHEVRNPLAGMGLFAGLLRDEIASDAGRNYLGRIERELAYLEKVVNEFLAFAKAQPPERRWVSAAAVAREAADLTKEPARVAIDVGELDIHVDEGQFRRAILNLLQNALDASTGPNAKAVHLTVHGTSDVRCEVANHGAPITAEVQAHMFEPFFTTKQKGTGLGLGFVQAIVTAHGGSVGYEYRGDANVFWLALPGAGRPHATAS